VGFRAFVQDRLKTIRKQNGLIVFATQSPRDALRSPIAHTIIEQCATQIFMPNGKAASEDYRGGMKLSAREFQLISELLTPGSRRFLIKQNGAGVVVELNLAGMTEDLTILSGTTASVALADELRAELGEASQDWLSELHGRLRAA
jgi:type IV secretion system protein VirB4